MENILLYQKIMSLPDSLKEELIDFIEVLKNKSNEEVKKNVPKFGSGMGIFIMHEDFDEPIEDFKEYM